jgi:hypothetical protein
MRAAEALRALGYLRRRLQKNGISKWFYVKEDQ